MRGAEAPTGNWPADCCGLSRGEAQFPAQPEGRREQVGGEWAVYWASGVTGEWGGGCQSAAVAAARSAAPGRR